MQVTTNNNKAINSVLTNGKLISVTAKGVLMLLIAMIINSCGTKSGKDIVFPKTDLSSENLIPMPLKITPTHSGFALDHNTIILSSVDSPEFENVAEFLAEKINFKIGLELNVNPEKVKKHNKIISIKQSDEISSSNDEAYQLKISNDTILLMARQASGAFRGVQTIRQLIPEMANDTLADHNIWVVPTGEIVDEPQYSYRASMIDVSRHFFGVEDIKKYLDVLAYYKVNVLHMHLSDDQGWRIEIKSWPKLTEMGASTAVGGGEGGFYTQEEFSEIVDYAAARFITIVPEIDMPGHTNAASVSYPFLNGNGKELEVYTGTKVGFSTFDARKDTVYTFIDDVVREISALIPGQYFHIGGDESKATKNDDYNYFVSRVEKIVQKYGKTMIGWDEIATTDISGKSVAQLWNSKENGNLAVEKDMKIILSPAAKTYLDMKYDSLSVYGYTWAGYIPVDTGYNWDPESYFTKDNVIGIEAPLWSETIDSIHKLEYLAFPRMIGYAELGWSTKENRNWENYKVRLANQTPYLHRMNVKYYPSPVIDWKEVN